MRRRAPVSEVAGSMALALYVSVDGEITEELNQLLGVHGLDEVVIAAGLPSQFAEVSRIVSRQHRNLYIHQLGISTELPADIDPVSAG